MGNKAGKGSGASPSLPPGQRVAPKSLEEVVRLRCLELAALHNISLTDEAKGTEGTSVIDQWTNLLRFVYSLTQPKTVVSLMSDYQFWELERASLASASPTVSLSTPMKVKNRYIDIIPVVDTKVELSVNSGDSESWYINANHVSGDGPGLEEAYIAAQGPLPNTVADFWRMIWEKGACSILMLTNVSEGGMMKCHPYWPKNAGDSEQWGPILVARGANRDIGDCRVRTFSITNLETGSGPREVIQLHYQAWPDQGVPLTTASFRSLLRIVDMYISSSGGGAASSGAGEGGGGGGVGGGGGGGRVVVPCSRESPLVVHCSAGIGRTGVFIAVHSTLRKVRSFLSEPLPPPLFDLFGLVLFLRSQRSGMVQTKEQYVFCCHTILEEVHSLLFADLDTASYPEGDRTTTTPTPTFIGSPFPVAASPVSSTSGASGSFSAGGSVGALPPPSPSTPPSLERGGSQSSAVTGTPRNPTPPLGQVGHRAPSFTSSLGVVGGVEGLPSSEGAGVSANEGSCPPPSATSTTSSSSSSSSSISSSGYSGSGGENPRGRAGSSPPRTYLTGAPLLPPNGKTVLPPAALVLLQPSSVSAASSGSPSHSPALPGSLVGGGGSGGGGGGGGAVASIGSPLSGRSASGDGSAPFRRSNSNSNVSGGNEGLEGGGGGGGGSDGGGGGSGVGTMSGVTRTYSGNKETWSPPPKGPTPVPATGTGSPSAMATTTTTTTTTTITTTTASTTIMPLASVTGDSSVSGEGAQGSDVTMEDADEMRDANR